MGGCEGRQAKKNTHRSGATADTGAGSPQMTGSDDGEGAQTRTARGAYSGGTQPRAPRRSYAGTFAEGGRGGGGHTAPCCTPTRRTLL